MAGRVSHLGKESCQLNREFRAALFFIVGLGLGKKMERTYTFEGIVGKGPCDSCGLHVGQKWPSGGCTNLGMGNCSTYTPTISMYTPYLSARVHSKKT